MKDTEMKEKNCGCEEMDFYEVMERKLIGMTFWARKQILFDKIRERVEKEEGQKLDKLVDLVVEASKSKGKKHEELRESLKKTFEGK
jgi:hypothetical protein